MKESQPLAPDLDSPFVVRLEQFSGPLDLLLHLIRQQELDITDIPIARVADQFLATIHQLGLNQAAEYLEMAAVLLRIKIQMLLPKPLDDDEWEDPRAELVRRLLEYEQIREVVDWLNTRIGDHMDRFSRGWIPPEPDAPPPPLVLDITDLVAAVQQVIDSLPSGVVHRVVPRPLDIEGATRRIREVLSGNRGFSFSEILGKRPSIVDLLSVLLAVLELARMGEVHIMQRESFGEVAVSREQS